MLGTALGVLVLAWGLHAVAGSPHATRYQQHLAEPSEAELGEKPVLDGAPELCTHLPIIKIDTGGAPIPHVNHAGQIMDGNPPDTRVDPECQMELLASEDQWNRETDAPVLSASGTIRIRGNSSRNFDKKSYLLTLYDTQGNHDKVSMLGMSSSSEWVLHGPFLDRTLLRNYLCYNLVGQVMEYAPNVRYCELILNGEYRGLYLLTEPISVGDGRIELTEPSGSSPVTSWLIRWDRDGKGDTPLDVFNYYTFRAGVSGVDLRYPGKKRLTEERAQYVTAELSEIEDAVARTGTSDKLDLTAFAQYFLFNEFFGNVDAGRFSTYYYKDIRGKMTPVVWDYNNACDNYISYVYDDSGFYLVNAPLFSDLLKNREFVELVIGEYRDLRSTVLSDKTMTGTIEDTVSYLGSAVDRNYAVWGYVFEHGGEEDINYLEPAERNSYSYEDSVAQLENWLTARGRWLDAHIEDLRQYCHPSKTGAG